MCILFVCLFKILDDSVTLIAILIGLITDSVNA
jgi:hypothetical protein